MKNIHDYQKQYLCCSDIASVILRSPREIKELGFGFDGDYYIRLIDDCPDIEVPDYYRQVFTASTWLWIYSDFERVAKIEGNTIEVYQAGATLLILCK